MEAVHHLSQSCLPVRTTAHFGRSKEFGMSHCTIDEVIAKADALLSRYDIPKSDIQNMFADTNVPGFNKALREADYPVVEANKDVLAGIAEVKAVIGDNRYFINKNSLEERYPKYDGPQGFKEEVLTYAYLPKAKQETSAKTGSSCRQARSLV